MLPVQCLSVLMKRVTVQQRPTWMFFMFCVWFPWYRLQVLTLFSTSAHHLCVMFLQNTTQTWATRRSPRISDRSHIRRRLQHRCAPHHGASAQRSVHRLEGDSVLHGGFFFYVFFFSSFSLIVTLCGFSSVSGWFIPQGQTPDCSGRGGGDSLPPRSGSTPQRH